MPKDKTKTKKKNSQRVNFRLQIKKTKLRKKVTTQKCLEKVFCNKLPKRNKKLSLNPLLKNLNPTQS